MNSDEAATVLVTGASGYIATHIVKQLLETGQYKVRGTVRSLKNEEKIEPLLNLFPDSKYPLELVEADLTEPSCWRKAIQGCKYVIHTASPFPSENPADENELIRPAVDGTLHVMKACRSISTVKRVVLTSSVVAITSDFDLSDKNDIKDIYDERDWSDTSRKEITPYIKSKVLAEKAAWDYIIGLDPGEKFELAVINPGYVMGPVLSGVFSTSMQIPKRLLERDMPVLAKLNLPVVDVRDVALAHVRALTVQGAASHRHIICNQSLWMSDIAQVLANEFKQHGYKVPTTVAPNVGVKFYALFDKTIKMITPMLSKVIKFDTRRMQNVLGISATDYNKTIIDMGYSMIDNGLVKRTKQYRSQSEDM